MRGNGHAFLMQLLAHPVSAEINILLLTLKKKISSWDSALLCKEDCQKMLSVTLKETSDSLNMSSEVACGLGVRIPASHIEMPEFDSWHQLLSRESR